LKKENAQGGKIMSVNSKRKGKDGELEFVSLCKEHGFDNVRRSQQNAGIHGDADVVGLSGIHKIKRKRDDTGGGLS